MGRRAKEANFWVSYSDLATGLMIVFMVVMLLMIVRSKLQAALQQDRVRDVVESIEIILNTKSRLAESINKALESEQVRADTVTAQVEIADKALSFEIDSALLRPEGRDFLRSVIPPYVCALWTHDRAGCLERGAADCDRLDPERPRGVRRILVRGHGSMLGGYVRNQVLSAERAQAVVLEAHRVLDVASSRGPDAARIPSEVWARLPADCRSDPGALRRYARERLWAVATGDSEHCTAKVNESGATTWCDDLSAAEKNDVRFQKVTFGLEVTGDDMTGLLLDVVALREEVGGDQREADVVERIAAHVALACWADPRSYHGCRKYVEECLLVQGEPTAICTGFAARRREEPDGALQALVEDVCGEPGEMGRLPGCGGTP